LGKYGIIHEYIPTSYKEQVCGLFQVKYHYKDSAVLDLVKYSVEMLNELLNSSLSGKKVSVNFPAIGYGRLSLSDVLPVVQELSDSVTLYIKDS
jgi:hypothetical protein